MIKNYQTILDNLICPYCKESTLVTNTNKDAILCSNSNCVNYKIEFIFSNGQPVLIDFSNSIFTELSYSHENGKVISRKSGKLYLLISKLLWGVSPATKSNVNTIIKKIELKKSPKVLIIGGGTTGSGMENIYKYEHVEIISFDVYASDKTQFIADAHNIPLKGKSIDCVIIQAVLEHVLSPIIVVDEIYRILKDDGIIYAETPFMQQVHEGAYDFTRYTESGHRWLFRNFKMIHSGYVRGVGVSLIWSIKYFFSGLFRSNNIGIIISSLFFWLRFIEKIIPNKHNIDAASGLYFLGEKSKENLEYKLIVDFYNRERTPD